MELWLSALAVNRQPAPRVYPSRRQLVGCVCVLGREHWRNVPCSARSTSPIRTSVITVSDRFDCQIAANARLRSGLRRSTSQVSETAQCPPQRFSSARNSHCPQGRLHCSQGSIALPSRAGGAGSLALASRIAPSGCARRAAKFRASASSGSKTSVLPDPPRQPLPPENLACRFPPDRAAC
jgi:hypothetical protein